MNDELISKALTLLERWVSAYERRLEFEERRDVRIAEIARSRDQLAQQREERKQAEASSPPRPVSMPRTRVRGH